MTGTYGLPEGHNGAEGTPAGRGPGGLTQSVQYGGREGHPKRGSQDGPVTEPRRNRDGPGTDPRRTQYGIIIIIINFMGVVVLTVNVHVRVHALL